MNKEIKKGYVVKSFMYYLNPTAIKNMGSAPDISYIGEEYSVDKIELAEIHEDLDETKEYVKYLVENHKDSKNLKWEFVIEKVEITITSKILEVIS